MNQTQVVIAGGGPTGLMLACELRLHGVGVIVLDRAAGRSGESRAGGLHARTLEMLEHRGIVDRFLRLGRPIPAAHFSGIWLDVSPLETRYPYVLGLVQARIEEVLEERAAELGVQVRWDSEVCGVSQDDGSVTVRLQDGSSVHADYLVGCDGGRSAVRRLAGIGFSGTGPTVNSMLADVLLTEDPGPIFMARRPGGDFTILQLEPGYHRVITNQYDAPVDRDLPLDFETVRATFVSLAGKDFGMHSPLWVSRYNDAARLADTYRSGRVFLAGDAAHIHWPAGGQGLNTGVQDAMNLGWKLALALEGVAGAELLDSYEVERRPVAQRVLDNTRAQVAGGRAALDDDRALRARRGEPEAGRDDHRAGHRGAGAGRRAARRAGGAVGRRRGAGAGLGLGRPCAPGAGAGSAGAAGRVRGVVRGRGADGGADLVVRSRAGGCVGADVSPVRSRGRGVGADVSL
jgi:2-polyprenyl-6-methoxyphenol hydroxylase-like FAD-dependent oxidoreductase